MGLIVVIFLGLNMVAFDAANCQGNTDAAHYCGK